MVKREKANYLIQSVSHALDVIEELCKAQGEMGVTELSKSLKLHKNNVFRLLATLELRGFVEQNKLTENYRLGVKALQVGQAYVAQSTLVDRVTPIVKALSEELGETVNFAVLQNGQIMYPVSIESKRPVRVNGRVGVTFSAKQSAVGRLLLAQLPDSELAEFLTGNTPQDVAIKNALADLRATGTITDKGAIEPDVLAVSKVVLGNGREVMGAIEILAPLYRTKAETLIAKLDEVVGPLSETLGLIAVKPGLTGEIEKTGAVGRIR